MTGRDLGDGMRARAEDAERHAEQVDIDDRVVLPLQHTRDAAAALCGWWCGRQRPDGHVSPCLIPLLERRDALLGALTVDQVSGDCMDPVKHGACSGCACTCHHHSRRTP
jgi:hypothetical protein